VRQTTLVLLLMLGSFWIGWHLHSKRVLVRQEVKQPYNEVIPIKVR
jgi:hypothetical protein